MIRRPPRSTPLYSSAASDVYKRQGFTPSECELWGPIGGGCRHWRGRGLSGGPTGNPAGDGGRRASHGVRPGSPGAGGSRGANLPCYGNRVSDGRSGEGLVGV